MSLGEKAFHPSSSRQPKNCLIAIFQSLSRKEYKDRLLNSFKNNGLKLIANATAALSMGVNFPDVRYVIMYGPARSLLDFHQEAGRLEEMACLQTFYYIFKVRSWHIARKMCVTFSKQVVATV